MENIGDRFIYGAKIILYIFAALLPIFFLPLPVGVEFGREVVFATLIILGAVFWILSILKTGEIKFQKSPILYAALFLLAAFLVSTIFSKSAWLSLYMAEPAAERFSTLILGLILMFLAGGVFKSQGEAGQWVFILLFSGALAGLFNILQMTGLLPIYKYIASFASSADFNVIGTANGLALFYGMLLVVGIGLLFSPSLFKWKRWMRYGLFSFLLIFLVNLLTINFRTVWIVLLGSAILLFGFKIRDRQKIQKKEILGMGIESMEAGQDFGPAEETAAVVVPKKKKGMDWQYALTILLIAFSVVMILVRKPLWDAKLPAEVSPSMKTTLSIAKGVFGQGSKQVILGSGPGTFGLDWSLYKNAAINQSIFWGIRFNQGYSWPATLLATAGIAGLLAFLVFWGMSFFLFLKSLLGENEKEVALGTAIFLGFAFLSLTAFLYPSNFSLVLLFFLSAGLLSMVLAEGREAAAGFWNFENRLVKFESPWAVFVSSLLAVLLLSLGAAALYFEVGNVRAVFAQQAGVSALSAGEVDKAMEKFSKAADLDNNNFRYFHLLAQARMQKIRGLIQRAAAGENVQEEFRSTVTLAIQHIQKAIELYPLEPILWRTQGALYEIIIPFIPGSEKLAVDSYQKSLEYDPLNPAIWVDLGRAHLIFADRLQLAASQASAQDRQLILKNKEAVLLQAEQILQRGAEVKTDYAPAHFLLAQTQIRLGNIQSAITNVEKTKLIAPFDVGVAFQLGLLYYQSNDLEKAKLELERAVSLNTNYSNARYFLGLIYDRQGDKERALKEFAQIEILNPDNQEVKIILQNLREGRGALESIVPPAEPPEKRKEAPVKEENGKSEQRPVLQKPGGDSAGP